MSHLLNLYSISFYRFLRLFCRSQPDIYQVSPITTLFGIWRISSDSCLINPYASPTCASICRHIRPPTTICCCHLGSKVEPWFNQAIKRTDEGEGFRSDGWKYQSCLKKMLSLSNAIWSLASIMLPHAEDYLSYEILHIEAYVIFVDGLERRGGLQLDRRHH